MEWSAPPGYKAMAEWAADLSPRTRERFRCRHRCGRYEVPSEFVIRDVLVRVGPDQLDRALQRFHAVHAGPDDAIAIDGKTVRNAVYTDESPARPPSSMPSASPATPRTARPRNGCSSSTAATGGSN